MVEKFGEAAVQLYNYTVKIKLSLNSENKIVSIVDNNTETNGNDSWWNMAKDGLFSKYQGKTKAEIEAMTDVVSGATYTSKALKQAVINAFNN